MCKLIRIGFTIFLIVFQLQRCTAFFSKLLGESVNVVTMGQFVSDMSEKLFAKPETMDEVLHEISDMHNEVKNELDKTMKMLENIPNIMDTALRKYNLEEKMFNLKENFETAVGIKIKIKNKQIENKTIYENFAEKSYNLDAYLYIIFNIITSVMIRIHYLFLKGDSNLQAYQTFCQTGVSQSQLLDNLFRLLRIASAQYFITKVLIYNFLDIHNDKPVFAMIKQDLKWDISIKYRLVINILKTSKSTASRALWTCDPKEYINIKTYTHLRVFQKYILNEEYLSKDICQSHDTKCPNIKRLDKCYMNYFICKNTRICNNELIGCESMTANNKSYFACINKSPISVERYTGIVENDEKKVRNFYCSPDNIQTTISVHQSGSYGATGETYHYCICICQELDYYISLDPAVADVSKKRIITGAKLSMMHDTLYIQIQEGELLANGNIDSLTSNWTDIFGIKKRVKISWDDLRSFDLTETVLPSDRIVTGLKFEVMSNRISLALYSARFDFSTGKLVDDTTDQLKLHIPNPAENEIQLSDSDVPIKSNTQENYPNSEYNQFVKLTTSSLEKDGGQTTIPFIDTQSLTSKYLAPLSGAGLIHRSKNGYGGFLSLKLYNYDITPYIENEINLNDFNSAMLMLEV